MVAELASRFRRTVEEAVPTLLRQMPSSYFHETREDSQRSHLTALVACRAAGMEPRIKLQDARGLRWTFIEGRDYPGLLSELVQQLPPDGRLREARVYTAKDASLVIDVFEFDDPHGRFDPSDSRQRRRLAETLELAPDGPGCEERMARYFAHCSAQTVLGSSAEQLLARFQRWEGVFGSEETVVGVHPAEEPGQVRIAVTSGNANPRRLFERIVAGVGREGLSIATAQLNFVDHPRGQVLLLDLNVFDSEGVLAGERGAAVCGRLQRLRWLDDAALELLARHRGCGVETAEVISALAALAHERLARRDRVAYGLGRIWESIDRHFPLVERLARQWLDGSVASTGAPELSHWIREGIADEHERRTLEALLEAARSTLQSNIASRARFGLCLKLEPGYLSDPLEGELPRAVFFCIGRKYKAFHLRFSEVARGGLRVVVPRSVEALTGARERLYRQVQQLAHGQHFKNKDIPEGGAKGVILVESDSDIAPSIKAVADGLLDVVLQTGERLLLGPDENVSPELAQWIVDRAAQRGYARPQALMCGQAGEGIDEASHHFTSEGMIVFFEEALRACGIEPSEDSFTVKMTGGPDGYIAGSTLQLLFRDFGERCRIVAIADASGSLRDPDGIDSRELLRLVQRRAPIARFDPERLGERAVLTPIDADRGPRDRSTVLFRTSADVFIPAGGPPGTLSGHNWESFLDLRGSPSSRIIVEAAHLFITGDARRALSHQAGVLLVSDASASKCGVVAASYEGLAHMLLEPEEFLAVKARLSREVLERVRLLAAWEARLLFAERRRRPDASVPELTTELGEAVVGAVRAIEEYLLSEVSLPEELSALITDYVPPVLRELAGDRIEERLTLPYRIGIVATVLATRILYREGLDFLRHAQGHELARLAFRYLELEGQTRLLVQRLRDSNVDADGRIAELLLHGGTRTALSLTR